LAKDEARKQVDEWLKAQHEAETHQTGRP
jgi:hypothetical protein